MNHPREYLVKYEEDALAANKGKKIKFSDNLGQPAEGYIQGAELVAGNFVYQVSKAKNPKVPFNGVGKGNWYLIMPIQITHLPEKAE